MNAHTMIFPSRLLDEVNELVDATSVLYLATHGLRDYGNEDWAQSAMLHLAANIHNRAEKISAALEGRETRFGRG
jgi:hypothetical protein